MAALTLTMPENIYIHNNQKHCTNNPNLPFTISQRAHTVGFTNACSKLTLQYKPLSVDKFPIRQLKFMQPLNYYIKTVTTPIVRANNYVD